MELTSEKRRKKSIETICAQADHSNDSFGAHVMPIYQTSTFKFNDAEAGRAFSHMNRAVQLTATADWATQRFKKQKW